MRVGLIGAGNMASALARGWGEPLLVSDVVAERAEGLAGELGGHAVASNAELADRADLVVLCHKPPQLAEVAAEVAGRARAVASILAATSVGQLEAAYPKVPVYRFIPNLPAEIGRGVLCYAPGALADEGPVDEVLELFGRLGVVIPLEDGLIDAAMAVMSCGPAYVALMVEALGDAGIAHGIGEEDARRMALETFGGTTALLAERGISPAELRERVATPGGTTEKGLIALEERGLRETVAAAVDAAAGARP